MICVWFVGGCLLQDGVVVDEMLVGALMMRLHFSCKFRAQMSAGKLPKIQTQCASVQIGEDDQPNSMLLHKSLQYPTFLLVVGLCV